MTLLAAAGAAGGAEPLRIVTVDPGHFHASLIQKQALPGISDEAYVYAPLGPDLTAHLNRVAAFNRRPENPTRWKLNVYAGADFWQRMLAEKKGTLAVLSGSNRGKIVRIQELVSRGFHVLGDKPWIIEPEELPALEAALNAAERNRVAVFDGMTQRYEIAEIVQKALVNDPAVYGEQDPGTPSHPGVYMESVHYLLKTVAGMPNLRPAWFFDVRQLGEGLTDVGTHLVDLAQWMLVPEQAIDYRRDVKVLAGARWPTMMSLADYQRVTGEKQFPAYLNDHVDNGKLRYFCNNSVTYTLRGTHIKLDVKWDFEAPAGSSDTELATFRGTRSSVELRQGAKEKYRPEVYVAPRASAGKAALAEAIRKRLIAMAREWPDLALEDAGGEFRIVIPDRHRIGHEAHFAVLVENFMKYVKHPGSLPAWEKPYMLAKYYVTTEGVRLARKGQSK